jgi:AcrR family transcriptional regulator
VGARVPAPDPEAGPRVDGRTARAERTRKAIVDAHVTLLLAGDLRPTAERIADRAGVSLRALWGHFADMETLFAASGARVLAMQDAAYRPVDVSLPRHRRIEEYCAQRARLLEKLAPAARAAQLKEPFSPALSGYRTSYLNRARDELSALFAPELDEAGEGRGEVLTALIAISMWPTWATLRDDLGLDVDAARAALARMVAALLPPAPGPAPAAGTTRRPRPGPL